MAFGRAPDKRKYLQPNIELQLFKAHVESEEANVKHWPERWGWILDEYMDLKRKLKRITERSIIVRKEPITDHRKILPIPNSVNHEYGWICSKPEFKLQIYGPDVPKKTNIYD